jgi:serine/threonine protein kinase
MTPERYHVLRRLYDRAVELPGDRHAAFLAEACAGDDDLRRHLESLLKTHDNISNFMAVPAGEAIQDFGSAEIAKTLTEWNIGQYKVLSLIGVGGMGKVYLARDTRLGRNVALKLLRNELGGDQEWARRFEREARAASALNHPNIVTLHDSGVADQGRYIVMEFVDGQTLRQRLADGPVVDSVRSLGGQMAKALSVAHAAGIAHRDVKPENVMIRNDGYVKVLDFGLARFTPSDTATSQSLLSTHPHTLLGTAHYMSPEQIRGEVAGSPSDIFSLGVVLYEMSTGRRPFHGDSVLGTLHAIASETPAAPSHLNPAASPELDQLILRMMAKDAHLRPAAEDVVQALARSGDERSNVRSVSPPSVTDEDFFLPRTAARWVFLAIQIGYLAMYFAALWNADILDNAISAAGFTPTGLTLPFIMIMAMCGIAVRLYLLSAAGFDHPATGRKFHRIFPVLLMLDGIWAASPLLIAGRMRFGTALACIAGLAYLPFTQRTLIKSMYREPVNVVTQR